MKSLPISGTGTHKYDFPHVEVPPLPVHFCDCEEHNVSDPTSKSMDTKTGDLDAGNGGMDEDEIKMMNTVLNKLFERQDASHVSCNETMAVKDKDNSKILTDNQPLEDNKEDSDEDNLVLNVMASGSNSKPMPLNSGSRSFKAHGNSKVKNYAITIAILSFFPLRFKIYLRGYVYLKGLLKHFGFFIFHSSFIILNFAVEVYL